jgi:hypothetical protein
MLKNDDLMRINCSSWTVPPCDRIKDGPDAQLKLSDNQNQRGVTHLISPTNARLLASAVASALACIVGSCGGGGSGVGLGDPAIRNVGDYGVKADLSTGGTDNTPALQSLLDSLCPNGGNANGGSGATIFFPTPPSGQNYQLKKPVWVKCAKIRLYSDDPTTTIVSYQQPWAFVFQDKNTANMPLAPSLVSGPGNAIQPGTGQHKLDLSDIFRGVPDGLDGLSAFTLEYWIKEPTLSGVDTTPVISYGQLNGDVFGAHHGFGIEIFSDGSMKGVITTSGTGTLLTINAAAGSFTVNAVHHVAESWDGGTVRLFVDGKEVASDTATGTLVVSPIERVQVGTPEDQQNTGAVFSISPAGELLDGIRISKVARYTSGFATPTAKFSNDGNTLALLNFDNVDGPLIQDDSTGTWIMERNGIEAVQDTQEAIENLTFSGGVFVNAAPLSTYERLTFIPGMFNLYHDNFDSEIDYLYIVPGGNKYGFIAGNQQDFTTANHIQISGGQIPFLCVGCGGTWNTLNVFGAITNGLFYGGSSLTINSLGSDTEQSVPNMVYGWGFSANNAVLINGGEASAGGGAPPLMFEGTQQSVTVDGIQLANPVDSPPTELVHIKNPGKPPLFNNPRRIFEPATVPFADGPVHVVDGSASPGNLLQPPAVTCSGTAATVSGRNENFVFTVGSANQTSSCVVAFDSGNRFSAPPICTAEDATKGITLKQSPPTARGVTLSTTGADMRGDRVNVSCSD